jgi:DNA polymerase-4
MRDIIHLNFIGFMAAVASVVDTSLRSHPFVIQGVSGGKAIVADASGEAVKEGVNLGMSLIMAKKRLPNLIIIEQDPILYRKCNSVIEKVASRYAPAYQSDTKGNWYLDITGTRRLFGPPPDCAFRVLNDILDDTSLCPAAAVAQNKLVSKVATRTIRPTGFINIRLGEEENFLSHQDIRLLPGVGPSILKTLAATGFYEIGELAALKDREAIALFGKKGILLRDTARGMDESPILYDSDKPKTVKKYLKFEEDVIENEVVRGAIIYLSENAGIDMRKEKLGAAAISLSVIYADGGSEEGTEKEKHLLVLDREISNAAEKIYIKKVTRRIRIRELILTLSDLKPLGYEPDLFIPEEDEKQNHLQEAIDKMRGRYGLNTITKALVLSSSKQGRRRISS